MERNIKMHKKGSKPLERNSCLQVFDFVDSKLN